MAGALEIGVWALLLIASVTDLFWGKIFNATTFPFLVAGLALRLFSFGWVDFRSALLAVGAAVLLFFPLYFSQVMAAGDVKLLMAAGAWLTPSQTLKLAGLTVLVGAFAGLVVLIIRRSPQKTRIPFAPAFLCAFSFLKIAEMRGWSLY
ncbi:MAG: prepilin peptidase [Proteobacteria bacterium]|nr:prepilin peptidase [Pseudomonadota bacterium]